MPNDPKINQLPASKRGEFRAPRRRSRISGPLTFAIVIAACIFVMSVFFRVSEITVRGNEHYTEAEIISAIGIEKGDNLFFIDRFSPVSRVFAKLPYVEHVTVERALPNRIVITVEECKAMAYLVVGDEEWTLDHNCKILGKAAEGEREALIPIVGIDPGTLLIGETLTTADGDEAAVAYLSAVLRQLQGRGIAPYIRKVDFGDTNRVSFEYADRFTVILGGDDNIEHKFGMFIAAMDRLKTGDYGIINVSDNTAARFTPI